MTETVVQLEDRADWRRWLRDNHASSSGVWLVTWKKSARRPRVDYDAAVEEALCYGWVDSKSKTVDDERTSLFFTPRKPKSSWSESNVARVERLEAAGLMRRAGRRAVEEAKAAGAWPSGRASVEPLNHPSGTHRPNSLLRCGYGWQWAVP